MSEECPDKPMKITIHRTGNGVMIRYDFCCEEHSPVPFLEVEHNTEGALNFAADIVKTATGPVTMTSN